VIENDNWSTTPEIGGFLSTDGRWIAYMSDESGRREMYVQPLNADGTSAPVGKVLVS